ncbi:siderophore-interacting protein [Gayadomonas joobiniege]|uniref:siderophore-interacting protein n=1 Tax=Gayadomonas joobiniege TaxID=1234606 RepID=UPI00037D9542|nr:siderophore-interacting protein [Gayadomonas joobiniege]
MISPKKANLIAAKVLHCECFSPHIQRITISADAFANWPADTEGRYFKLFITHQGKKPNLFSPKRSYTVHSFDAVNKTLVFDAVVNRHNGPATQLIGQLQGGETLYIAGPGKKKLDNFSAEHYLFIGDITSINAIRAYLNLLPANTPAQVYLMVPTEADAMAYQNDALQAHNNHQIIHWIINPQQTECNQILLQSLAQIPQLPQKTKAFIATEAGCLRLVKNYLQQDVNLSRRNLYASAYWKLGTNADKLTELKQQG